MADATFAKLVTGLLEGMGQSMAQVREIPEGMLVRTTDGFVWAFLADPNQVSLATVQRFAEEVGDPAHRLVVLTNGRLPLALSGEVSRRGGTLVEGGRFQELVRGLGLGPMLGEEPRAAPSGASARMLPSVQQLEEVMVRARTWASWGVPALALRFYHHAVALKPEFLPAQNGAAAALLALGLPVEARKAFDAVLTADPTNVDARLGLAAILGQEGKPQEEIARYREMLAEAPGQVAVRAHLVAALVAEAAWPEARTEIEQLLEREPEDPALRYLHAATLERTGELAAARGERDRALALGLSFDRERAMAAQLGLPEPPPRPEAVSAPIPPPPPASPPAPFLPFRSPLEEAPPEGSPTAARARPRKRSAAPSRSAPKRPAASPRPAPRAKPKPGAKSKTRRAK